MEIELKASKFNQKVNLKEVVKNFFDFSPGSALTEIFSIEPSKEMKAFLLLFTVAKRTNIELYKQLNQNIVDKSFNISTASDIEDELKSFLEHDIKLTKDFFDDGLNQNFSYMTKSFLIFRKFAAVIEIEIPDEFEFIYYLKFREILLEEFINERQTYKELVEYFENNISNVNTSLNKQIDYYLAIKKHFTAKLQPHISESKETLKDLYIDPNFVFLSKNIDRKSEYHDFLEPIDQQLTVHKFLNKYFLKGLQYEECVKNYNMLFLLGQPGQGKTSLCYRVIYDYLEANLGLPNEPIFFVKIRDLDGKSFVNSPFEEINLAINQNLNFNETNCILILDGLDEAYMGGGINDDDLRNLYYRLNTTTKNNKKLKIILTSRLNYLKVQEACLDGSLVIQLRPLNDQQIISYANKFKKFYPKNVFIKQVKTILQDKKFAHIKELLGQAVLIYFISISDIAINADDSKALLYNKIFNTLAERGWDRQGQLDYIKSKVKNDHKIYEKYLRIFIRGIAFEIYQSPNLYITLNRLVNLETTDLFVKKCFDENFIDNSEKLKEVTKYLLISFYFQESNQNASVDTAIEFFHNSLWEYLSAEYMWEENKKILLQYDDDEDYTTVTKDQYFRFLDRLIGNKRLSYSVLENLIEIIKNENAATKISVAQQSKKLFFKLLEDDFLLEYSRKNNLLPSVKKASNIFNLFWTFYYYSNIELNEVITVDDTLTKYLFIYSEYRYSSQYEFRNIIFTSDLYNLQISDGNSYHNVEFRCAISHSFFYSNVFINCCFNTEMDNFCMNDCIFESVVFDDCDFYKPISVKNNIFKDCKFLNVEIPDQNWYKEFLNNNTFVDDFINLHTVVREEGHDWPEDGIRYYLRYNK